MKTVFVTFSNHFDLIWRRGWERSYEYQGGVWASYSRLQEMLIARNLELAEKGEGAYELEQCLSARKFLEKHPKALKQMQQLYEKGLFEVKGAGEAIIDVNMCSFETMARNLASGTWFAREVLKLPPLLANHGDGFGSSAQFPQVIRGCGYRGVSGLSYCAPDKPFWRGLDGSTVFLDPGAPGAGYFFDHCYHEPCRDCQGKKPRGCPACKGTGVDLLQNTYPPFDPAPDFKGDLGQYSICSEEMFPPEGFSETLKRFSQSQPDVAYRFGTSRNLKVLRQASDAQIDSVTPEMLSSRVENNPVQTGCYVSRTRIKQGARRCEAIFYGWEKALALTVGPAIDRQPWEDLFIELPLFFFHDAITGTHQDEAYAELMERMQRQSAGVEHEAIEALRAVEPEIRPNSDWQNDGRTLWVFNPNSQAAPVRVHLPVGDWQKAGDWAAITPAGERLPVVTNLRGDSPPMPKCNRLIESVGPAARTRPAQAVAFVEAGTFPPLAWTPLRIAPAKPPSPAAPDVIENTWLRVELGARGVEAVTELSSGSRIQSDPQCIGELLIEDDEGDPWGTRKIPAFRRRLGMFTEFLGAKRFEGYSEAYYGGRYTPNLPFGREQDPSIFALDWYVTVRLLDGANRIDFIYEVFWKSANRRLRAAFPVQSPGDAGLYSVPGGWLKRERYEQTETCLWSPNGDWPALHFFASRPAGGKPGWALLNYGTPSSRIEDGRLLASLVRSPGFSHCLERYAQHYPMPTDGICDPGWHHFTLSLMPYRSVEDLPGVCLQASALNSYPPSVLNKEGSLPTGPTIVVEGDGVELVACKPSFDPNRADQIVLRVLNYKPESTEAVVAFKTLSPAEVRETDMTERPLRPIPVEGGRVRLGLTAFQSKTLCVSLQRS